MTKLAPSPMERNLEEEIFQLQKLHLDPSVSQVVEEAAQLFAEGRHLEAGALIEKAEAMRAPVAESGAGGSPSSPRNQEPAGQETQEEQAVARLVSDVATGLTKVLVSAIQNLQQHIAGETQRLTSSFSQQLEKLQASVESLLPLKERIEQLTQTVHEQRSVGLAVQEKYEQLTATAAALEEANARHESELGVLRNETKKSSASTSQRLNALSARLGLQQEELSGLKSTVSEVSPRVAALVERLDRQAEAIRSFNEYHAQREAALDQLANALANLKESSTPVMPEGQL